MVFRMTDFACFGLLAYRQLGKGMLVLGVLYIPKFIK